MDIYLRTFLCVMCFSIVRGAGLHFKIGVLVEQSFNLSKISTAFVIGGRHNLTVEILWRKKRDDSVFCNSQAALSLVDRGANVVFEVKGGTLVTETDSLGFNWVLPLTGIGTLHGMYRESHISTTSCDRGQNGNHFQFANVKRSLPEQYEYSVILLKTMAKIKWTNALLVYDEDTEPFIDILPEILNPNGIFLTTYKMARTDTADDLHQFLHDVYTNISKELYIVVLSGTDMTTRLMRVADSFDALHSRETALYYNSRWLIFHVGPNSDGDLEFVSNLFNVAIVTLPFCHSPQIPPYLTLQYMLNQISESDVMMEKYANGCLNSSLATEFIQDVSSLWSKIRNKYVQSIRFPIKTLMFHVNGRSLATVGYASLDGQVDLMSNIFPNVKYGLNGKLLTITTLEYSPFEYLENGTWKGLCIDILEEMKRKLNFTYQITSPADGEWGRLVDGSWTGLVGQLERREVDLMAAPLSIQEERTKVMDFTFAFFWDVSVIMMKKPDPKETQWRKIVEPLEWKVIVLTTGLVPVVALILSCVEAVNPAETTVHTWTRSRFYDVFLYVYGCMFMQGGTMEQRSQTSRTIVCCWWLFCIVLAATYCGNLIAYLTVNKETPPFNSLATMVEQDEYQWGTLGGTYWVTWLEHSTNPVLQKVWNGMKKFNRTDTRVLSPSTKTQVTKVGEGKYAYIAERSFTDIITSSSCDLQTADEEFLPLQYGLGLPRNSPFTKMFSDMILDMHESGLMKIWKQRNWPERSFCSGSLVNEAKAITWNDIQLAFGFLGAGLVISCIVLVVEKYASKIKRKQLCDEKRHSADGGVTLNGAKLTTLQLPSVLGDNGVR